VNTIIALIPARAGSERVPKKNIKILRGHPLIAYTISAALKSEIFSRVIVTTNSAEIRDTAMYYGAEVPFLRPDSISSSVSPDIEWIKHAFSQLEESYDCFSILRPTSPFRKPETIQRAWNHFNTISKIYPIDSLRAVQLCHEHPGKMWILDGDLMKPYVDQSHLEIPWHAGQYQALPKVFFQNSSLEIAWTRVVKDTNSREGNVIAPFITEGAEGFSVDHPYDFELAEIMIQRGDAHLPEVDALPYH